MFIVTTVMVTFMFLISAKLAIMKTMKSGLRTGSNQMIIVNWSPLLFFDEANISFQQIILQFVHSPSLAELNVFVKVRLQSITSSMLVG